jgi:DNA-binding transcriptional LysR family regulator
MNLDLSAVRTFVAAVDLRGFARAAHKLHRSPGAISLQMKSLEERIGCELFMKSGRQQVLTPSGEIFLGYARRLLQLNDETLLALGSVDLGGEVTFGMPQDFAENWLPHALARFSRVNPAVRIGIKVGRSAELAQAVEAGELDLALIFGPAAAGPEPAIASLPVFWFGRPGLGRIHDEPVPLLVLDAPCMFRQAAIEALDRAHVPWRIAMSSASVSAVWAAAEAGLGVTVRTRLNTPPTLGDIGDALALPRIGPASIYLLKGQIAAQSAAQHLELLIRDTLGEQVA